jgi:hypothetical protein
LVISSERLLSFHTVVSSLLQPDLEEEWNQEMAFHMSDPWSKGKIKDQCIPKTVEATGGLQVKGSYRASQLSL